MFFTKKAIASIRRKDAAGKYYISVEYKFDPSNFETTDALIEKAVGKSSDGSGTDFKTRDMSFSFKDEASANLAKSKVEKLMKSWFSKSKLKNLKVTVNSY